MAKILENQIFKIPQKALKKGVVILDLEKYRKMYEKVVPTYYLKGKEAEKLDKLVEEGLKDYKEGRCKSIKSLADLD